MINTKSQSSIQRSSSWATHWAIVEIMTILAFMTIMDIMAIVAKMEDSDQLWNQMALHENIMILISIKFPVTAVNIAPFSGALIVIEF